MTLQQDKKLPNTAMAVLGLLRFGQASGYDLKQFADASIRHFYWTPAKSQIYAELRRLREAGLVTEEHVAQETRPDKRVYRITSQGTKALNRWLNAPDADQDILKSTTLLKIFVGRPENAEALADMVRVTRDRSRELLAHLQQVQEDCAPEGMEFLLMTVRCGLLHARSDIQWADETLKTLEEIIARRPEEAQDAPA